MQGATDGPATKAELRDNEEHPCPICDRPLGLVNVDRHHIVPKCHGGREMYFLHKVCHRKIHATFTEKELEKTYNTWEALRAHEVIASFVKWIAKKEPSYYDGSRETASRKQKRR